MKPNQARRAQEANARQMVVRDADPSTIAKYCQPRSGTPAARPPPFAVDRQPGMEAGMAQMGLGPSSSQAKMQQMQQMKHMQMGGGMAPQQPSVASRPTTPAEGVFATKPKKAKISVSDVFPDELPDPEAGAFAFPGQPPTSSSGRRSVMPPSNVFQQQPPTPSAGVGGGTGAKAGRRMVGNPFPGEGQQFGQLSSSGSFTQDATAMVAAPPSRGCGVPTAPPTMIMQQQPQASPYGMPDYAVTPFGMQPASKLVAPPPSFAAKFAAANGQPPAVPTRTMGNMGMRPAANSFQPLF